MELLFGLWDDCSRLCFPPAGKQTTYTQRCFYRINLHIEMEQRKDVAMPSGILAYCRTGILLDNNCRIKDTVQCILCDSCVNGGGVVDIISVVAAYTGL
jgi:hypothetical protein